MVSGSVSALVFTDAGRKGSWSIRSLSALQKLCFKVIRVIKVVGKVVSA